MVRIDDLRSKHLHVVLNDPKSHNDFAATVAVVSLSSTLDADKTVVLLPGDHPFIRRETYVIYGLAKVIDATKLESKVKAEGEIKHNDDCSPELFERIREGVFKSPFSRPVIKAYLEAAS